jgi:hypothetical protein
VADLDTRQNPFISRVTIAGSIGGGQWRFGGEDRAEYALSSDPTRALADPELYLAGMNPRQIRVTIAGAVDTVTGSRMSRTEASWKKPPAEADLDEAQMASWVKQAATLPGWIPGRPS